MINLFNDILSFFWLFIIDDITNNKIQKHIRRQKQQIKTQKKQIEELKTNLFNLYKIVYVLTGRDLKLIPS